jgi:hypothetical protein
LVRAARYLGVPPWELERRSIAWRDRALIAESAEAKAAQLADRLSRLPGA